MSAGNPSRPQDEASQVAPEGPAPGAPAGSGRSWSQALLVVGMLAVIGVAAYVVIGQVRRASSSGQAIALAGGTPVSVPMYRGRLTVTGVGSGGPSDPAVLLVALGRTESPPFHALVGAADPRRLLNEIIRQSILVAAHDRLSAVTRDAMIGEEPPAGKAVSEFDVTWLLMPLEQGDSTLKIMPVGGDPAGAQVVKLPAADPATTPAVSTYLRILERAEVLAREGLPEVFKALHLDGPPIAVNADGALPPDAEEKLATLTFTEQFAALRAIHAAIRSGGESPQRLGGLIRGYAHLGVLTESHWNPAHDVFKARALLTAQRWVARQPRSAEALRHRAYAHALAGLHRFALDDLAAARALPAAAGAGSRWEGLIDAYCRFDTKALLDAGSGADRDLARLLAFLTVEGTSSPARRVELGRALLRENPECYRVHDAVCAAGGVSVLHEATVAPLAVYAREVPGRLHAMADLPGGIAPRFDDPAAMAAAAKALADAGRSADRGEPSWGVLGRLMDETCFVQVWRRAAFLAVKLGVPAGDFVDAARPLFAGHTYGPFVESFGVDGVGDPSRYATLIQEVKAPAVDVELSELPFYVDALWSIDEPKARELFQEAMTREDILEHDLTLSLKRGTEENMLRNALCLEDASPHSPVARAMRIEKNWNVVEQHARAWEAADSPDVLVALGRQYLSQKRWEDAQRCLERGLALAPDKTTYQTLAQVFQAQGDWKRWQATLDRFLSQEEDYGLDHATVQAEIANHLMDEGRWKDAEPYAAAAAESWAAWAMMCAVRCYEGLQDWPKAELWASRTAQRYPGQSWAYWYDFCMRTGEGDLDAAREFAARYIESVGDRAAGIDRIAFGFFHLLNGQKPQALAMFRGVTDEEYVDTGLLYSALTADTLGDVKLRDECLERLTTDPQYLARTKSMAIIRLYRAALAAGDKAPLDLDAVRKELDAMPASNRERACFHVGWFLALHGSPNDARAFLDRAFQSTSVFRLIRYVAREALRDPARVLGKASP